jgi:hypothetical protein
MEPSLLTAGYLLSLLFDSGGGGCIFLQDGGERLPSNNVLLASALQSNTVSLALNVFCRVLSITVPTFSSFYAYIRLSIIAFSDAMLCRCLNISGIITTYSLNSHCQCGVICFLLKCRAYNKKSLPQA